MQTNGAVRHHTNNTFVVVSDSGDGPRNMGAVSALVRCPAARSRVVSTADGSGRQVLVIKVVTGVDDTNCSVARQVVVHQIRLHHGNAVGRNLCHRVAFHIIFDEFDFRFTTQILNRLARQRRDNGISLSHIVVNFSS